LTDPFAQSGRRRVAAHRSAAPPPPHACCAWSLGRGLPARDVRGRAARR